MIVYGLVFRLGMQEFEAQRPLGVHAGTTWAHESTGAELEALAHGLILA